MLLEDQFLIPVGNRYSLHNQSTTEQILLHFVLVKPANTWMAEFQAQTAQAAQMAMEAHERNRYEEEAENEYEEEEEEEEEYADPARVQLALRQLAESERAKAAAPSSRHNGSRRK